MRLSEHLALVAELEGGQLQPDLAAADLRAITQQALEEAVLIDGRKAIASSYEPPAASLLVSGDARLLLLVIREVISNALKLATTRVEVHATLEGDRVEIRVEDDGPGFAADASSTLGRRFVARTSARGLGLSLSMAMEILKAHGGGLTVSPSRLPPGRRGNVGAAVMITLPVSAAAST